MPYQADVQRWRDFYIVAGTSAATLVGLLFVGLSLHIRIVVSRSEVRSLARVTLANFGLVLFLSLFLVIRQDPQAAMYELLFSGLVTVAVVAPSLIAAARSGKRTFHLIRLVARVGLSILGYAGVVLAGVLIGQGAYGAALNWLLAVVIVLLVVSLRNSWDLLVSVADAANDDP
jgi:hypothetical protein